MISVSAVTKSFNHRTLWSDLSFEIESKKMVAIVGPSGSGKSTLLNCLGLLDEVDSGRILVDGKDVTRLRAGGRRRFRRDALGYLFQNYALIDNADVEFNLNLAILSRRGSGRRIEIERALQAVGLAGRNREMVYRLSGGEQQRLAVARLLLKRPKIILADEPTGALDCENADMVFDLLRSLASGGCAVVIATHSKEIESRCDGTVSIPETFDSVSTKEPYRASSGTNAANSVKGPRD